MNYARFDPQRCDFPKARVSPLPDRPELPRLSSRRTLARPSAPSTASSHFRHFARGRYALAEAYRLAGVGRDGALLAPAYHCVTMLDPAMALGADVQLYPVHADLSPDSTRLDALLLKSAKPVKALLATHFFGFPQDFTILKQWCDKQHIALIEDCAHVLFTERFQAAGTGTYGRFVVASPYKFFACADGGLLYSAMTPLLEGLKSVSPGLIDELRGLKHIVDGYRGKGPTASDIDLIDSRLTKIRNASLLTGVEQIIDRSQASAHYCAAAARTSSLRGSRALINHSSIDDNVRRRRDNFQRWAQALANLPNCHALLPSLPSNCAPYMFPLHIAHPTPHFYYLKHLGVPVWRWDEMAISPCEVARDYRLHLIHLPCHQALSDVQMDWMVAAVQKTLATREQGDR